MEDVDECQANCGDDSMDNEKLLNLLGRVALWSAMQRMIWSRECPWGSEAIREYEYLNIGNVGGKSSGG